MNLTFHLTEKEQKKSCMFTAFCVASLVGQLLLAVFLVIYILWNMIGDAPPVTVRNLMKLFSICIIVFVLLLIFLYKRILIKDNRLVKGIPTYHCSLTPGYVLFYSTEQPELNRSVHYRDFRRILTVGQNIFFSIDYGKKSWIL